MENAIEQMSEAELEYRISDIEETIDEYYGLLDMLECLHGIQWAMDEGFVEAEVVDKEMYYYPVAEAEHLS